MWPAVLTLLGVAVKRTRVRDILYLRDLLGEQGYKRPWPDTRKKCSMHASLTYLRRGHTLNLITGHFQEKEEGLIYKF